MYESRHHPLLSRRQFLRRWLRHLLAAGLLIAASLGVGMAGYAYFEHLSWIDGFLNSSMLLGGMGPVDAPKTDGGKLFAGIYALYAGLVFIVGMAIAFAPVVHRLLHKFHLQDEKSS
ncbi:MAG: hypothetical protein JSS44_02450 [Proteobacteria bacterium]|nr:hypothetical protein [Pseudomonadota bacterium]MBS0463206.1 hypothetical protein [Pseudomonadota bacterium]MBS0465335.1 hypothetical protein [Pseudomonadota bacterium]